MANGSSGDQAETPSQPWDGFIRIPGGLDCAICGNALGSIDNPRSNPAESYAGTYTGLCYGCERSAVWGCYRCEDGLVYYSHPPSSPSWRRDRQFYFAYGDCDDCRKGAVRVSRSDAMGGSYNTQCTKCRDLAYAHPVRAAYLAEYEAFQKRHGQVMERLEKEFAKKIKKLDNADREILKTKLKAEYETWRAANVPPASPSAYFWNYELKRERLFMEHPDIWRAGKDEVVVDPERRFYVSVVDGETRLRYGFLIGPFKLHQTALSLIDDVSRLTQQRYPWSHFYSFGTCSIPKESAWKIAGVLNAEEGFRDLYVKAFGAENSI